MSINTQKVKKHKNIFIVMKYLFIYLKKNNYLIEMQLSKDRQEGY